MWLSWVLGSSRSNRELIYAVIQFYHWEKGGTVPPKVTATILLSVQFYLHFFACLSCSWLCLSLFLTKPAASEVLCHHLQQLIILSVPQKKTHVVLTAICTVIFLNFPPFDYWRCISFCCLLFLRNIKKHVVTTGTRLDEPSFCRFSHACFRRGVGGGRHTQEVAGWASGSLAFLFLL